MISGRKKQVTNCDVNGKKIKRQLNYFENVLTLKKKKRMLLKLDVFKGYSQVSMQNWHQRRFC